MAEQFKVVLWKHEGAMSPAAGGSYDIEMESLKPAGAEIIEVETDDEDEFIEAARDADALYVHRAPATRRAIESLEKCRVISTGSVGTDKIDIKAATERGIPVTNVPDVFIDEVADHAMTLILATYRRIPLMNDLARDGRWSQGRSVLYAYPRLLGMTLGLISFGNVARAVAMRAAPFGIRVVAHDPYVGELAMTRMGIEPVGLVELLQRSDIVSMHAPLTSETYHMLGEDEFRLMKPHSILINSGRGETVDEAALIQALDEGWIGAAGLDVLEKEPPDPDNPLLKMEKAIITPHVASASARMEPERRRRVGREIALVLRGRWPRSCANPSVLDDSSLIRWKPHPMD